jgi:hypothetical protein
MGFALIFALIVAVTVYVGIGDRRAAYLDSFVSFAATIMSEPSGDAGGVSTTDFRGFLTQLIGWVRSLPVAGPLVVMLMIALFLLLRAKLIAFPASPSALLAALSRQAGVKDFRERLDFRHQFGEALGEVATALRTPRSAGLVVFIDDLDRCQPQDVIKILEAVNFIVSTGPCIVMLGMDRHQIEHAVGLAFNSLVPGLSNEELDLAAGEQPDEIGRRRAFARLYLEKLINLEISIPPMNGDAALTILGANRSSEDVPRTPEPPRWVSQLKRQLPPIVGIARVSVIAIFIGAILLSLLEQMSIGKVHVGFTPPLPSAGQAQPGIGPTGNSAVTGTPISPIGAPDAAKPAAASFKIPIQDTKPDELPNARRWMWWLPSMLVILVATLWGLAAILRREKAIRQDSPEFAEALSAVEPLLATRLTTPRAIKSWQNRIRFIAERMSAEGRDVDAVDRLLHWVGGKIGREWVPKAWFEPPPQPKPSEPALILLGAIEAVEPKAFQSRPEEVMSNFDIRVTTADSREGANPIIAAAWQRVRDDFQSRFSDKPLAWPDEEDIRRYIALPETHGQRNGDVTTARANVRGQLQ